MGVLQVTKGGNASHLTKEKLPFAHYTRYIHSFIIMDPKLAVNRTTKFGTLEYRDRCDRLVEEKKEDKSGQARRSGVWFPPFFPHLLPLYDI